MLDWIVPNLVCQEDKCSIMVNVHRIFLCAGIRGCVSCCFCVCQLTTLYSLCVVVALRIVHSFYGHDPDCSCPNQLACTLPCHVPCTKSNSCPWWLSVAALYSSLLACIMLCTLLILFADIQTHVLLISMQKQPSIWLTPPLPPATPHLNQMEYFQLVRTTAVTFYSS